MSETPEEYRRGLVTQVRDGVLDIETAVAEAYDAGREDGWCKGYSEGVDDGVAQAM